MYIQWLLVYSHSCETIATVNFRTFIITPNRNPIPIKQPLLISPFPQPPSVTNLPSVSIALRVLDASCKWNHTLGGLSWLASFTLPNVFEVPSCCSVYQYLISFYCWIYSILRIFHNLFIHSFIGGHLDCFHLSSVMSNADINVITSVFVNIFSSLGYTPGHGIAESYNNSV